MSLHKQFLHSIFFILLLSCNDKHGYYYTIEDFRKPLQPCLLKMVTKGIVMSHDDSLSKMATDKELFELSQSEHPILRSSAIRELLQRKSVDHFKVLMNHLDDTAIVATDAGEFGISFQTVTDDMISISNWKTQEEKNITIDSVLTRHNYLRSAYLIFLKIDSQQKYYQIVKDMATRPRRLDDEGNELDFDDIEYAMYGLAKFKKPADVAIIKHNMMENVWKLSFVSFQLMKDFPDSSYFEVLQKYHRRQFYRSAGHSRYGFSGYITDRADPEDFIRALVMQQDSRSAKLLDTMLKYIPLQTCMPNKSYIKDIVIEEIWDHPCLAYAALRKKTEPRMIAMRKWQFEIPMDSTNRVIDTAREVICW